MAVAERERREAGLLDLGGGGRLTIDLAALAANWRSLHDRSGGAECAAVVKADAYGIGLEPAVEALAAAGCRTFFVAHASEGLRLRAACAAAVIYVLNGLGPGSARIFRDAGLRPVLGSVEEMAEWGAAAGADWPRPAIQVDTGMNRLGLRPDEALGSREAIVALAPALIMSHFVSAEMTEDPLNARQIAAFAEVRHAFPRIAASLANSSGIFLPQAPHCDLVRPGYALYGGNPTPARSNPMRPVVRLEGRIVQIRKIAAGETVGYNAQWIAPASAQLAIVSVGYADGLPRAASGTEARRRAGSTCGEAVVAGRRCPFAGRLSMDLLAVDVTALAPGTVGRGDWVTLIGGELSLDVVAASADTIGYELLTRLGRRYERVYRRDA